MITKFDIVQANAFIGGAGMDIGPTQGNRYFVKPISGGDGNSGKSPRTALKTLAAAFAKTTTGHNDIVYLLSEGNTASATTDYFTETLTWDHDCTHLIGVGSGNLYNQRTRIAWKSDASAASNSPLITLSGNNCCFANIGLAVGHASDDELAFGLNVTGDRNTFNRVSVAYPVDSFLDVVGGYALKIDGADDCHFEDCVFGSYTIDMGTAANQIMLVDGGCSMTSFRGCRFINRLESSTNSPHVRLADALSVGFGCLWFDDCAFISTSVSNAYDQHGAFKTVAAQTDGRIIMKPNCITNAAKWDVDDLDNILISAAIQPAADTNGLTFAV